MNARILLLGIGVQAPKQQQEENVYNLAVKTAEKIRCPSIIQRDEVTANTDYVGEGYGIPTESGQETISMFAELKAILLDPVYSAKSAAGLLSTN